MHAAVARLPRNPSFGVAMARPATVCQRIERILAEETTPAPVTRLLQTVIAAAVAPLAMLTAVLFAEAAPLEASWEQVAPHTRITIDPKLLDAYAGFYLNAATDSLMIVTREDDHLLTRRAGNQPVPEYPYTDHDFFLTVVPHGPASAWQGRGVHSGGLMPNASVVIRAAMHKYDRGPECRFVP
jgi:Domain of unknown function (DUF3471)